MGSIVPYLKSGTSTDRGVTLFRAHVRRKGFASKSKVFSTKREAKKWLRDNEAEVTLAKAGPGKTLKALIDEFAEVGNFSYARMSHLDFWVEQLGRMRARNITHADINGAVLTLQSQPAMRSHPGGAIPTERKRSPATINRYLSTLSKVFSFALQHGVIDVHPMKGGKVSKLKEGAGRTRILTEEEEGRPYTAAAASEWPMLYLLIRLVLTTAARRSEALHLKWSQIKLDQAIAVLGKTKNGRPRSMPLVADVRELLVAAAKVRPLKNDYVFFDPKNPERPKNIDRLWTRCREAAGLLNDRDDVLDRVVLHTTRHSAVTKMLKGGANLAQIAAISGHQTLAMLKRYEHLAAADSVQLAEKLLGGKGVAK